MNHQFTLYLGNALTIYANQRVPFVTAEDCALMYKSVKIGSIRNDIGCLRAFLCDFRTVVRLVFGASVCTQQACVWLP